MLDLVLRPRCFFCDSEITWDSARITFWGKVLCPSCNGDSE